MEDLRQQFINKRIKELQESTDFVNNLLIRITGYAIVVGDFDGNIIVFNEGAHQMFGLDPREVVGIKNIRDFYPDRLVKAGILNMLFDKLIKQGACLYELERERSNGDIFPGQSLLTILQDNEGRLVGFVEIIEDITERKRKEYQIQSLYENERTQRRELEASEAFNRDLLTFAPNPILVTGLDGSIIHANPALTKLTGYSTPEIIRKRPPYPWWPREKAPEYQKKSIFEVDQESCSQERCFTRKNGQMIWVQENIEPIKHDGVVKYYLSNWVDVTERKKTQEQLEKSNKQLIELDKLKDNFISMVSHEMRTPLTSIKCYAELLMECDEDLDNQKEFLGIINNESDRLVRLINDFLDITKIKAGRMQWHKEELSIAQIIKHAVEANKPLIEKGKLAFNLEIKPDLPLVRGDRDRLIQVVTNLVGNAIKFTPENGEITIQAWYEEKYNDHGQKNCVLVSVTDTGIGIAQENHQKIFETFGQVGNPLRDRPKGTGLGLPICKNIIESLGGAIWVESSLGRGSSFYFSLAPSSGISRRAESQKVVNTIG